MEYKVITMRDITGLYARYKVLCCYTFIAEPTIRFGVGTIIWPIERLILSEIGLPPMTFPEF